jgi:hypothetical protein
MSNTGEEMEDRDYQGYPVPEMIRKLSQYLRIFALNSIHAQQKCALRNWFS